MRISDWSSDVCSSDLAPLAFAHAFDHRAGHVEHRVEVAVDDLLPLLRPHLVEGAVAGDAGVVDQDVDRAHLLLDLAHPRLGALPPGTLPLVTLALAPFSLHPCLPLPPPPLPPSVRPPP